MRIQNTKHVIKSIGFYFPYRNNKTETFGFRIYKQSFPTPSIFQYGAYSNMNEHVYLHCWRNLDWKEREGYVNFSLPQILRRLKPCAMICTLGSFCPRMSAKIRLLVLFPLQPEHVPFNGTSDQTLTSINQLISQESKLNMLYPKVGYFGCGNISILQPSKMLC